jgi:hypothetical protein
MAHLASASSVVSRIAEGDRGRVLLELRAKGIDLCTRTLRTWIARLEPPKGVVEECLQALDQAIGELRRARAMLTTFRSRSRKPMPYRSSEIQLSPSHGPKPVCRAAW